MALNDNFNHYGETTEQDLIEDLTIETIEIYGYDFVYIPRTLIEVDELFGEEKISDFDNAITIEMYMESVNGFEGDGDMFAKFGFEIRDSMSLILSKKRFLEEVDGLDIDRPHEGDLIYYPMTKSLFSITFVEHENPFYQRGKLFTYKLSCELFEYSQEKFTTGDDSIDSIDDIFENDDSIDNDVNADNDVIETESNEFQDFTKSNPFGNY